MLRWIRMLGQGVLLIPVATAVLVTYVLTLVGLFRIVSGAYQLLWGSGSEHEQEIHEKKMIAQIFRGLDLLFVAPMAIMIIYALYLLAEATLKPERYDEAKRRLVDAKAFILGLLATAVAVHFVERVLRDTIGSVTDSLVFGITILVIGVYGLLLDRVSMPRK